MPLPIRLPAKRISRRLSPRPGIVRRLKEPLLLPLPVVVADTAAARAWRLAVAVAPRVGVATHGRALAISKVTGETKARTRARNKGKASRASSLATVLVAP